MIKAVIMSGNNITSHIKQYSSLLLIQISAMGPFISLYINITTLCISYYIKFFPLALQCLVLLAAMKF